MKKPIVLVIMDGVGRGDGGDGDAVKLAKTPTLDMLLEHYPPHLAEGPRHCRRPAHRRRYGQLGGRPQRPGLRGQVYSQGAKLVEESITSGQLFQSKTWTDLVSNCLSQDKALHFLGLLSDGNVHSNISHLLAMLKAAKAAGVRRVYCHILLDGRDVPATSALTYVEQLEATLAGLREPGFDYAIASGVAGCDHHGPLSGQLVHGRSRLADPRQGLGRQFPSAKEAIETYREETHCIDQDLPAFVVARDGKPVAPIANGDSVILFNFRGDRAQEISPGL